MVLTKAQFKEAVDIGADALLYAIRLMTEGVDHIQSSINSQGKVVITYQRPHETWSYVVTYSVHGVKDEINVYLLNDDDTEDSALLGQISASLLHHHLVAIIGD